eukprot:757477-Hanusia_phi.AAC.1
MPREGLKHALAAIDIGALAHGRLKLSQDPRKDRASTTRNTAIIWLRYEEAAGRQQAAILTSGGKAGKKQLLGGGCPGWWGSAERGAGQGRGDRNAGGREEGGEGRRGRQGDKDLLSQASTLAADAMDTGGCYKDLNW